MTKSSFPGMNPYLEQFWGDIHSSLMVYFRDQINDQLPGDLQARVEESLMVDTDDYSCRIYPDVDVAERPAKPSPTAPTSSNTAVAEPCVVALPSELRTERHIEIIDRNSGNRVVTAIELLSPANKCKGAAREAYLSKLRPTDADIVLQLQPLLDECYLRGRYASLDYTRSLTPQFDGDDRIWINELLQKSRQ